MDKKYICDKTKCSGCGACLNICPKDAIKFEKNSEGFLYPIIDEDKCINCGACKNVCPVLNEKNFSDKYIKCYAAKSNNVDIKKKSSSGGIFSHLALKIIEYGGVVYGALMEDLSVRHVRISSSDDLYKILGSKYTQSEVGFVYKDVLRDLLNEKKVLFSGTPCQIMGLKSFLKKEYDNLYCVSVICHGVTSDYVLDKRIESFERLYDTNVNNIVFRSKRNGWEKTSIEYFSDSVNKNYSFNDDPLMFLYLGNYILRDSCYNCSSKGLNRNGADIILGDYWGVYNVHQDFFDDEGVSCVILKTDKGEKLFNDIFDELIITKTNFEDIIKYNGAFDKSVFKPMERISIFNELQNNDIKIIYDKYKCLHECNDLKNQVDGKEQIIQQLTCEKDAYYNQLQSVYNSKRFKIIDKTFNTINRIRMGKNDKKH